MATTSRRRRSRGCAPVSSRSPESRSSTGSARCSRCPDDLLAAAPGLTPQHPAPGAVRRASPAALPGRAAALHAVDEKSGKDVLAGGNPLCGFLVPDHVGRALAAHDAAGKRLGELRLVATADGASVVWDPEPLHLYAEARRPRRRPSAAGRRAQAGEGCRRVQQLPDGDRRDALDDRSALGRPGRLPHRARRTPARARARAAGLRAGRRPDARPGLAVHVQAGRPAVPALRLPREARRPSRPRGRPRRLLRRPQPRRRSTPSTCRRAGIGSRTRRSSSRPLSRRTSSCASTAPVAADVTLLVDPRARVYARTGVLPATRARAARRLPQARARRDLDRLPCRPAARRTRPGRAAHAHAYGLGPDVVVGRARARRASGFLPFPAADDRARFSPVPATAREGFVQVDPTPPQEVTP